jgi:hypothetical protein
MSLRRTLAVSVRPGLIAGLALACVLGPGRAYAQLDIASAPT